MGQGYVFTRVCDSVHGAVSQHTLQVVSQHALQWGGWCPSMPCRFPGPHPEGKLKGLAWGRGLQAHTQGGSWGVWPGGSPGPHPGERVSRPTPRGDPNMHWGRSLQWLLLWVEHILLECILVWLVKSTSCVENTLLCDNQSRTILDIISVSYFLCRRSSHCKRHDTRRGNNREK